MQTMMQARTQARPFGPSRAARRTQVRVFALKKGDMLPTFEIETDASSKLVPIYAKSSDIVKDNGAVIFVYPKANTPGCTTQACDFRDNLSKFEAAGYKVYGLSPDEPASQAAWKKDQKYQYTLLCDPGMKVIGLLGAMKDGKLARSHFVIERGGRVKDVQVPVAAAESMKLALAVCDPSSKKDALDEFCETAPDADECRVYSD